ncbi:hypothetical protein XMKAXML_00085 [Enterococcus phage vB_OCPT_PG13]|nr:hypothetical protein EMSIMAW_00015 [Enterococcus phage vB_OCPT_PG2]UQT01411.1 hypothetical protein WMKKAML_00034 [Enterococcus phage vB_OCPT_PG9]UQT01650.1 hypothetical protein XMKAXML_00085 [Enterococcus phage vB_OCPT_PG13]
MKSIYEQFNEGTLYKGQRFTVTGTIEKVEEEDPTLPILVKIDGGLTLWFNEGTIKHMKPAAEKLYEVSIGGYLLSYYGCDYTGGSWNSFLWRRREMGSDILVQAFPMSFLEKHFPEAVAIAQEANMETGYGNLL